MTCTPCQRKLLRSMFDEAPSGRIHSCEDDIARGVCLPYEAAVRTLYSLFSDGLIKCDRIASNEEFALYELTNKGKLAMSGARK